jgi:ATP-dependent DNA helicase RecG
MTATLDDLAAWMAAGEDEHLEFKEAKNRFDFELLVKYCCALANEGGGRIVLGVTDRRPRRVVGSQAFENLQRTKHGIVERLRLRIDGWELIHGDGRVLVFEVPGRPLGMPIQYEGAYWMRSGETLTAMTPDLLRRIFDEGHPDFSADTCEQATLDDLDPGAVSAFRTRLAARLRRQDLPQMDLEQLLIDTDLYNPARGLTFSALILLGRGESLTRLLGEAEVVFEYRSDEASIPYQQRVEYRQGFLGYHDDLWRAINSRNETYSVREGLFRREIPSFNEDAVREAVLNAVCHRDYRVYGSTFVRQSPQKIEIVSPGGFPPDVTPENVLFRQSPRNRRLAEAMARCGLVERSGQGADRMFQAALQEGKLPPDFSASTNANVSVVLNGTVQDAAFVVFLERLSQEAHRNFQVADLVVLDAIHRELDIPEYLRPRVGELLTIGAIERAGRSKFVLSRRFYELKGRPGEYTRRKGLDRQTRKELLLRHIASCGKDGAPFAELAQVLPDASRDELKVLLRELRIAERIRVEGTTRSARWFAT